MFLAPRRTSERSEAAEIHAVDWDTVDRKHRDFVLLCFQRRLESA
jgi:hypothetical protein